MSKSEWQQFCLCAMHASEVGGSCSILSNDVYENTCSMLFNKIAYCSGVFLDLEVNINI